MTFQEWNDLSDTKRLEAYVALSEKNASLAKELRDTDVALGDYTVNIIRSLPEAAAKLRAERDQFKAMWERDSTALGKALAQRDTARTDAEDKRARVAELEADAERFAWVLPIVSGDDDATADAHAMALALHLGRNLTGRAAIDAAMRDVGNKSKVRK